MPELHAAERALLDAAEKLNLADRYGNDTVEPFVFARRELAALRADADVPGWREEYRQLVVSYKRAMRAHERFKTRLVELGVYVEGGGGLFEKYWEEAE